MGVQTLPPARVEARRQPGECRAIKRPIEYPIQRRIAFQPGPIALRIGTLLQHHHESAGHPAGQGSEDFLFDEQGKLIEARVAHQPGQQPIEARAIGQGAGKPGIAVAAVVGNHGDQGEIKPGGGFHQVRHADAGVVIGEIALVLRSDRQAPGGTGGVFVILRMDVEDDAPVRPQHALPLDQDFAPVRKMHQHVERHHRIELVGGELQIGQIALQQTNRRLTGL